MGRGSGWQGQQAAPDSPCIQPGCMGNTQQTVLSSPDIDVSVAWPSERAVFFACVSLSYTRVISYMISVKYSTAREIMIRWEEWVRGEGDKTPNNKEEIWDWPAPETTNNQDYNRKCGGTTLSVCIQELKRYGSHRHTEARNIRNTYYFSVSLIIRGWPLANTLVYN